MAVFFPDVSSWQAGLTLQPGTAAVIAKATEGTGFTDPSYAGFKAQAARIGAIFSAYHFLHQGNGAAQADHAFAVVGPGVPLMLDVEPLPYIGSRPTIADCQAFITRYRQLGGHLWATYFPRWYWQQVPGDLSSLGTALIASGYPPSGYSDADPNWFSYGRAVPAIWQYTNAQPYGGKLVDFNAYRGTPAELAALIRGGIPTMATVPPTIAHHFAGLDLSNDFTAGAPFTAEDAAIWADARAEAAYRTAVANGAKLDQLLARPAVPAVDVDALAAVIAPKLTAGATADELAHAFIMHLGADLAAG
jgi:hypothetical protein